MGAGSLDPAEFVLVWALAGAASIAVFLHAEKHGSRHATAWGIGTFLFLGLVAPIYVIRHRLRRRRRQL
jgi:hypothetical protein